MKPQSYVVVTIGMSTLLVAGARFAQGRTPGVRVFIGGTVAAFVLSAAAGPLPDLAKALATVAILAAVLNAGYAVIRPLAAVVAGTT